MVAEDGFGRGTCLQIVSRLSGSWTVYFARTNETDGDANGAMARYRDGPDGTNANWGEFASSSGLLQSLLRSRYNALYNVPENYQCIERDFSSIL